MLSDYDRVLEIKVQEVPADYTYTEHTNPRFSKDNKSWRKGMEKEEASVEALGRFLQPVKQVPM